MEPSISPVGSSDEPSPPSPPIDAGRLLLSPTPCFRRARSSSVSSVGAAASLGIFRLGFLLRASSNSLFCRAFKFGLPLYCLLMLLRHDRHGDGLRLPCTRRPLLNWRRAIALLERTHHHRGDELLLTMIVKLNDNPLFGVGHDSPKSELQMFDLGS